MNTFYLFRNKTNPVFIASCISFLFCGITVHADDTYMLTSPVKESFRVDTYSGQYDNLYSKSEVKPEARDINIIDKEVSIRTSDSNSDSVQPLDYTQAEYNFINGISSPQPNTKSIAKPMNKSVIGQEQKTIVKKTSKPVTKPVSVNNSQPKTISKTDSLTTLALNIDKMKSSRDSEFPIVKEADTTTVNYTSRFADSVQEADAITVGNTNQSADIVQETDTTTVNYTSLYSDSVSLTNDNVDAYYQEPVYKSDKMPQPKGNKLVQNNEQVTPENYTDFYLEDTGMDSKADISSQYIPDNMDKNMQQLSQAGKSINSAINSLENIERYRKPRLVKVIDENMGMYGLGARVQVDWTGPIEPLVREIATYSGYQFKVVGMSPAIPVLVTSIHNDVEIGDIVREAHLQAKDRADIVIYPKNRVIEIRYTELG